MPNHPPRIPGPSGPPFEGSIFWNPSEAVDIVEMPLGIITTGTQDMGNGVYWLRAGTPLDEYFAVSNDEDAVYLVAEDFYFISTKPDQAKIVPLITSGYVDLGKAEKAAGITYTDACLSALETAGIVMVDGTIAGGGGGGGLPPYENEDINKVLALADSGRTVTETLVAIEEQTVTTASRTGTAKLTVDYTYWAPGRTVHLTVGGNNYDCVIDSSGYIQATVDGHAVKIWAPADLGPNFQGPAVTTYTVSATIEAPIPIPAPAWVPNTPFFINISSEIIDEEMVRVADKTPSEVTAAFKSGRAIYLDIDDLWVPAAGIQEEHGIVALIGAQFIAVSSDGVQVQQLMLMTTPTGEAYQVTQEDITYPST